MKKLLLLLCALLTLGGSTWAATYTITYGTETGTFYKSGSASTDWSSKWVSNEAGKPVVTITTSVNSMNGANARIAPQTYTIYAEPGYKVTGFAMNCPTFGATVTVTPAGESAVEVAQGGTLTVNSSASSFVFAGGSNQARIQAGSNDGGSFTITVEDDPEAQSWIPSFGVGSTIVVTGDKAESVTAATNGADNDHWYLITQVRNGESALYDNGTQLMRGATDKTATSFNGVTVDGNTAYLVRFISAGSEDLYHLQLGNGKYIVNLDANPDNGTAVYTTTDYRNKGTHAFYNSNSGSGSYFGWNLNSKTGKKVDNNGAGNALSYWGEGTASGTSGNSIWYVYPVTINTPAATVDVTYDFYVNSVKVNTKTVTVGANSEINIPSSLTAGYSSSYYNFNTSGSIGDTDCTITVTAVLKDNTVVYPYTSLSNSKSYYIYTNNQARGGLSTYTDNGTTYLAASVKSGLSLSPKKFAIISYESNYYLYSVDDAKFVTFDGAENTKAVLSTIVTTTRDRITFTQTNAPLYEIKFDGSSSKIFNASNSGSYPYGMVFNTWGSSSSQWDDGCQYTINEAEDFDPTTALAILEFSDVIAKLEAYPYGTGLNQYSLVVESIDYTTQASTIISGLKAQGYSADNLATAQALIAGTTLNTNVPVGFYRIQGQTSSKYLAAGLATNNKFNMTTATDATTIFYFDGSKLVNFGSGMANGMNKDSWAWVVGSNASDVTFHDGKTNGGYGIKSATAFFYDNGDNTSSADRGTGADMSTGNIRYRNWYLTEISTLPVSISSAGYATLYAPVALTIPSGVKAYVAADNGEYLTLTEVETTIPANTGVILEGSEGTYDFDITTGVPAVSNALTGSVAAIARPADSYILSNGTSGVGFYKDGATTIPGFKAYLAASGGTVKTFRFNEETAIEALESAKEASGAKIYNLAGQRVTKAKKGIYIVGGRKVVIK